MTRLAPAFLPALILPAAIGSALIHVPVFPGVEILGSALAWLTLACSALVGDSFAGACLALVGDTFALIA